MRGLCAAVLLSSLVGLPGCKARPRGPRVVMLAIGDYLREDYLECLKKTRSPVRCDVSGDPLLIEVRNGAKGNDIVVASFHEGFAALVQRSDGSIEPDRPRESSLRDLTATVLDAHHLRVEARGLKSSVYVFVGDLDRYVGQEALAGRYTDDRGQGYVFGSDGWATFPDRRFEYVVGSDHVLNNYDYFYEKAGGKVFAFQRHNGLVLIFKTAGDHEEIVDKRPSWSLRELTSAN